MSLDRHKLWMLILGGGGFGLLCMLIAIQEGFLIDEPGDDPPLVMTVLVKLAGIVTVFGLLGLMPWLALRYERLAGKPWTAPKSMFLVALMIAGLAAVAGLAWAIAQSLTP